MKIGIGSDHRGYLKKQKVIKFLKSIGYNIIDYGTNSTESVDFPDYAFKVGEEINKNTIDFGIVMCANGIGVSIAANKVKNIRCAKISNSKEAKHSRIDNNCNIIALGSNLPMFKIKKILKVFLTTSFNNEERFIRRINKIKNYEH